ncbi:hypothetical protein IFM58399_09315 [Aspergillus lentulus]|uniref:uncharacterized protein n=1 Tax=Aspergillus lentulus TaxID=293939 RepID=UPI001392EA90|nr:uncharacterized protein IFM58399_09315 [Aspergillus lentulus]GFF52408.1 hypothetical protein IFM58399_09315 [Aspergillus lentulus]GFF80027.1 hypothetical protein IFM62136_10210 [Aspergillus lentulus]GFG07536.1 hypothetical protein IFM61392_04908 [Aspergillus lentulus]
MQRSPYSNDAYTVGWISASHDEFVVGMAVLDEEHGRPQSTPADDTNAYHLGRLSEHNVVMACLSGGQMGTGPAAIVAENMRRTFKNIRFALLVGIGGGVPAKTKDIRLGDVVVSYPTGIYTGIVQYDYGKLKRNGEVERKDWFCAPPRKILAAVDLVKAYHMRPKNPMNNMSHFIERLGEEYAYPGQNEDFLYQADYDHKSGSENCDACDESGLIARNPRSYPCRPNVHHGVIASGSMVIKSGVERDRINQRYGNSILCFDMEAAGLMSNFPCLVVRGISDYSDSHKNDKWRFYAVATASAYAKELLSHIEAIDVRVLPSMNEAELLNVVSQRIEKVDRNITENTLVLKNAEEDARKRNLYDLQMQCERWLRPPNMRQVQQTNTKKRLRGTCGWIWSNTTFVNWYTLDPSSNLDGILYVYGPPGCGKSILASYIVDFMSKIEVNSFLFAFSGAHASQRNLSDLLRSLIWQLLRIAPAEDAISVLQSLAVIGQLTTTELWTAFGTMAALVSEPVFCIIDGIDECEDTAGELVEKLLHFLTDHSRFRFILLGRHRAFHAVNCARHTVEVESSLTEQDIETLIEAEISLSDTLNAANLRHEVTMALKQQADGNFLWIKFMLRHLDKSVGVADALERLHNLPYDLQTTYEQLLLGLVRRLEPSEIDLARKILSFIVVAQRPLTLDEFQHMLAADALSTSSRKDQSIDDYLIPRLDRRVLEVLCTRLNAEHEKRLQQYGQNDSRTERIRLFLGTIQNTCGFRDARIMGARYKNTSVANDSFDIKPMVQVLQKEGPFPPHFGLDLLLKLQTYIRQFEKLTDPLQMLFRAIVRKASALPILALLLVAMFYYRVGREEDCLEILTVALEKVKGKEGPLQFLILESIASVYDQLGQHEMAWAHWTKALDGLEKKLGPDHEVTLFTIYLIGFRSYRLGKYTDALSSFMTVFSRHEKKLPRRQLDFYRHISYDTGRAYVKLHQYQQALPFLSAALSSSKKLFGQKEVNEPHKLFYMGITYSGLGQYMEALEALHKALGGLEKRYGEEHRNTLFVQRAIGIVHVYRGEYKEGVLFLSKALSELLKFLEEEDKSIVSTLHWMGVAYMNERQYKKALDILSRALPGLQMVYGPDHPYTLRAIRLIEDAGWVHFSCRTELR